MITATDNIFPSKEYQKKFLDHIDNITLDEKNREAFLEQAKITHEQRYSEKDRRSKIMWINDKQVRYDVCDWVYQQNSLKMGLDLYPFQCEIQYAEYHADEEGHFEWHRDQNPFLTFGEQQDGTAYRKLSASMHLNDYGVDYEGGKFEFREIEIDDQYYKRGSFILFPSALEHRVPPVTKGVRRSLVFFFHGPRFR